MVGRARGVQSSQEILTNIQERSPPSLRSPTPARAKNTFAPCIGCTTPRRGEEASGGKREGPGAEQGEAAEVEVVHRSRGGCRPLVWVGYPGGILVRGSCGRLSGALDGKWSRSDSVADSPLHLFLKMLLLSTVEVIAACHFHPASASLKQR